MVLTLQQYYLYRKSNLGVDGEKSPVGECLARLYPAFVATRRSVLPVLGPAAEPLLFRQKEPKPLTPRPAPRNEMDASHRRASQLAALKQGSPGHESVHPEGRAAGVGHWEMNISGILLKECGAILSV